MRVEKNTIVSLNYELSDADGNILEKTETPISYLHGGYGGIFPLVEEKLHEKEVGYHCSISMEPEDTFGEYDSELIRVEPRDAFPDNVSTRLSLMRTILLLACHSIFHALSRTFVQRLQKKFCINMCMTAMDILINS